MWPAQARHMPCHSPARSRPALPTRQRRARAHASLSALATAGGDAVPRALGPAQSAMLYNSASCQHNSASCQRRAAGAKQGETLIPSGRIRTRPIRARNRASGRKLARWRIAEVPTCAVFSAGLSRRSHARRLGEIHVMNFRRQMTLNTSPQAQRIIVWCL